MGGGGGDGDGVGGGRGGGGGDDGAAADRDDAADPAAAVATDPAWAAWSADLSYLLEPSAAAGRTLTRLSAEMAAERS